MGTRLNPNILLDLTASLQQSELNETIATQQLASGRDVNQLSDDPAAAAALVTNHDRASQDAQYLQNQGGLQSKLQVADSTVSDVVTAVTRALSLAVEGANGTLNASNRQAVATEVQGILNQVVGLANTTYEGTYLFSGTAVDTQPFTYDPTTNTVTYNGNTGATSVAIASGNSVVANIPGSQLFQNAGGSVFGSLTDLLNALNTNTNLPSAVTEIQNAVQQLDVQRVPYGNSLNQITQSESFLNQDTLNLSQQENTLVGADLSKVATNFSQAELANQATITATGEILSRKTLLDYIV